MSRFGYAGEQHKVIDRDNGKSVVFDNNLFYNYIIIHQGILDKLNKHFKTEQILKDFIDCLKCCCDLLVVTSGRGQPDILKKDLKFLPFSNLESFILKPYHEKFLMIQVLNQLIREREVK